MLDALVTIATSKKELIDIPIKNFIISPGKIKLNSDEVILKFKIPLKDNYRTSFLKLGSRKKLTISRIGLCVGVTLEENIIKNCDIVVGAISLKPVVLDNVQKYLVGKNLINDFEYIEKIVSEILSKTIMEITPEKFDRDYKVWAAKGIVCDIFDQLRSIK